MINDKGSYKGVLLLYLEETYEKDIKVFKM